jgi:hypothetical protein
MNQIPEDQRPSGELAFLDKSTKKDLITQGYMDQDGVISGAGKHLIPLLLETIKTAKAMRKFTVAFLAEDEAGVADFDLNSVFEAFYQAVNKARTDLHEEGYENVEDRYGELILPQMDWIFCVQYSAWMAQNIAFDMLMKDPRAFDENHPDVDFSTLKLFREIIIERKAKWSLKIVDKALAPIG